MEIYGPFPTYTSAPYLIAFYDHNTGIAEFGSLPSKQADDVAFAIFDHWISKFGIPKLLKTHFQESMIDALEIQLAQFLSDHRVVFGTTNELQMPEELYEAVHQVIQEAQLSWTDFIPALQFSYNTSKHGKLKDTPFKLLFAAEARPFQIKDKSVADDFVHLKLNIYLEMKKLFQEKVYHDSETVPNVCEFQTGQKVFFWEKSFGDIKWQGPFPILRTKEHKVQLDLGKNKTRWFMNERVALSPENFKNEDAGEIHPIQMQAHIQESQSIKPIAELMLQQQQELDQLIKIRARKLDAGQQLMTQLINQHPSQANYPVINAIQDEDAQTQHYLRTLAFRVFNSPLPASEALTAPELQLWSRYPVQELNTWLTGHPLLPPEWRNYLCKFETETRRAPLPPEDDPIPEPPEVPGLQDQLVPQPGPAPLQAIAQKTKTETKKVLKTIKSFSSAARKSVTSKFRKKPDRNNNQAYSQSTFFRELAPEDLEVIY